ncbi:MAG: lipase [Gaiellales bacterium]|jgi:pimeloyl-ACP methyl ester carboxylesterase|nr:lipase [Gaiellales bacterium]
MSPVAYRTVDVETEGGALRVGCWGEGERVVLAAHGVTANHREFLAVAERLDPNITLVAPDLRGRGGSQNVGGPFGMETHADDLARIMDRLGASTALAIGHSMGGFVAVVAAARHPERIHGAVLIDGGLPPAQRLQDLVGNMPIDEVIRTVIGPSLDRLDMTFADAEAYLDFWRPHPSVVGEWNPYLEDYFRYDLAGTPPEMRPRVNKQAVLADSTSDFRSELIEGALDSLTQPVVFLRAPRGVFNEEPPLYTEDVVADWLGKMPQLRAETVPDVNHFTITLSARGAEHVAHVVNRETATTSTTSGSVVG